MDAATCRGVYEPRDLVTKNSPILQSLQFERPSDLAACEPRPCSTGPNASFRPTHHGGRSAHGPTTVRAATRLSKRPCRLSPAIRRRGLRPIARVTRGQHYHKVVSEHGTTAGKRLEEGTGRVEARSTEQRRPGGKQRASGGAPELEVSGPQKGRAERRPFCLRYEHRTYGTDDSSILRLLGGPTVRQTRTVSKFFGAFAKDIPEEETRAQSRTHSEKPAKDFLEDDTRARSRTRRKATKGIFGGRNACAITHAH